MSKQKKITLSFLRNDERFTSSLILKGNGKLKDFDNPETGERFRYAQFNLLPIVTCPFRSTGCETICYATKGNHRFSSVMESRKKATEFSKLPDFAERMIYTIGTEMTSGRYFNNIMLVRVHESGDFYSIQYLRKWVSIWSHYLGMESGVRFIMYTKSFPFFNRLTETEKLVVNTALKSGLIAISASMDDTTSPEQKLAYLEFIKNFPRANTYFCTEHPETVKHNNVCDCADCARCGHCNRSTGETNVVKIHSASKSDMETYRQNRTA